MVAVAEISEAARTRHFIVDSETTIVAFLRQQGILTAADLLDFGAIYLNRVRMREDRPVKAGDYLRVHPIPKRYPVAAIDWHGTVIAEDPDFLVVNKPVGIPVHASLDNAQENLLACLGQLRGEKLYVTQRLDTATSGLVFLARTERAQVLFNRYLSERKVQKRYLTLSQSPPPLGSLVHYLISSDRAPHRVLATAQENTKRCELVVEKTRPVANVWESEVELLTGRTHQVRVQLSAIGCPLLGDPIYGGAPAARLGLHAFKLAFLWKGLDRVFEQSPPWRELSPPPSSRPLSDETLAPDCWG